MEELIGQWLLNRAPAFFRRCDRWFQRPIGRVVAEIDELRTDPARTLRMPIDIGPKRRLGTGFCVGAMIAIFVASFTAVGLYEEGVIEPGWPVFGSFVGSYLLSTFLVGICIGVGLPGGRLQLRQSDVVFTFRKETVLCPWELFHNDDDILWHSDLNQLIVPVRCRCIREMSSRDNKGHFEKGWNITARHVSPWQRKEHDIIGGNPTSAELLMSDIYRCEISEIVDLLRHIAERHKAK